MGEVVNLRQARKRADRRVKEAAADANRTAFGLSTKLKAKLRKEAERRDSSLDGHWLDKPSRPAGD